MEQPGAFVRRAVAFRGTVYYAEEPVVPVTVKSRVFELDPAGCTSFGGTPLPDGLCCETTGFPTQAGPATPAFDLATLGTPPFRLEF